LHPISFVGGANVRRCIELGREPSVQDVHTPEKTAVAGWWVQVRGQAYGPYSAQQLSRFIAEGRVRPATQISNKPDSGWREARRIDGLMHSLRTAQTSANSNNAPEPANIFVFAQIQSGAWNGFTAALEGMGLLCELAPGLWLVRTLHSAGILRNTLSQTLEMGDKFVVMDATRDRFAWFNLGPEIDVRIKNVWNAPLKPEKAL
jgi:hypothetical protein